MSAADSIIEALELAAQEMERLQQQQQSEAARTKGADKGKGSKLPPPNPLMLGLDPSAYVLRAVGADRIA